MAEFINLSSYRFVTLDGLPALRSELEVVCRDAGLKGTILLSPEGINLFVAGTRAGVDRLLADLRGRPGLHDLEAKESISDHAPFDHMRIKIKREIIAFGVEGIHPDRHTSPKLSAQQLKQWLDEGRPITLLDTRNEYEARIGTFTGALRLGIDHFRDFPAAVRQLPESLKDQPVVMFCTGGIRCEKAGPLLEREGFRSVHQLEGGILRYFEQCGGAHYTGECFVFDQRVGVGPDLLATGAVLCEACQMPVRKADQVAPDYLAGKHCPSCVRGHPPAGLSSASG
ncbi:MAG: rhodanese-like domain-containing protein [Opitutaceae bacterium]